MTEDAVSKYIFSGDGGSQRGTGDGGFGGSGMMMGLLFSQLFNRDRDNGHGDAVRSSLETQNSFQQGMTSLASNIAGAFATANQNMSQGFTNVGDKVNNTAFINLAATNAVGDAVRTGQLTTQIAITADGAATRALLVAHNEANLNRLRSESDNRLAIAENRIAMAEHRHQVHEQGTSIVNTLTNSQAQAQAQVQLQGRFDRFEERLCALHNEQIVTNKNINTGLQVASANPTNTNIK